MESKDLHSEPLFRYTPKVSLMFEGLTLFSLAMVGLFIAVIIFIGCGVYAIQSPYGSVLLQSLGVFGLMSLLVLYAGVIIHTYSKINALNKIEYLFYKDKVVWKEKGLPYQEGYLLYRDIDTIYTTTNRNQARYGVSDLYFRLLPSYELIESPLKNFVMERKPYAYLRLFNLPNAQKIGDQLTLLILRYKEGLQ
jgi:hypothetical protein